MAGTGFQYGDKDATPDGLTKISLKPGEAGRGKISVSGKGTNLGMATLPLDTPVTVQITRSDSLTMCWEATFSSPSQNLNDRFKGKSD